MTSYLKYLRLEWCQRDQYCVPQGPSFPRIPNTSIAFDKSVLSFKAPRHSPSRRGLGQLHQSPGHDVLRAGSSLVRFGRGVMSNDHWGAKGTFSRRWAFWGPWMTGCKAELTMSVRVIGQMDKSESSSISYFHPRAFETVFATFLDDYYGHHRWDERCNHVPRYIGPVDWQRHQHLPVFSGSCKIYNWGDGDVFVPGENGSKDRVFHQGVDVTARGYPDHLFFFPITEKHFVLIQFKQHLYSRDQNDDGKFAFDTRPVQKLQDDIFNSITLELSPEAQASYDRIKAEQGNMQLSKEFAPLKWPTEARTPGEPIPEGKCHHDLHTRQQQPALRS